MMGAILSVSFDETLVSAEFMAEHLLELEGVDAVHIDETEGATS